MSYVKRKLKEKICNYCNKEFETKFKNVNFCCARCKDESEVIKRGGTLNECKLCGIKRENLTKHISSYHNITTQEYMNKFECTLDDLISKKNREKIRENAKLGNKFQLGDKNPAYNHGGKLSPFSKNFIKYDNLTEDEKQEQMKLLVQNASENRDLRNNNSLTLSYYITRGYSEEEAKAKLKERQTTFSLEKCIEQHGEEEGRKRWLERQEKWLKNYKKQNYSKISQKLFWQIYEKLDKNLQCYFKELNDEYTLRCNNKIIKPDFIILDTKKVIEFDGNYWHSKARGNITRDKNRDNSLMETGYKVLHILERDYNGNSKETVNKCLEFLNG